MFAFILSTLAELGIIFSDYKHRKQVARKEKTDGKQRPMEKYFLQPSVITIITLLVLTSLIVFLSLMYRSLVTFPEKTETELAEMTERMEKWKKKFGSYPDNFDQLIGNDPLRQRWKKDLWNRPYHYSTTQNDFLIISAGPDGKLNTEDDIKSK